MVKGISHLAEGGGSNFLGGWIDGSDFDVEKFSWTSMSMRLQIEDQFETPTCDENK